MMTVPPPGLPDATQRGAPSAIGLRTHHNSKEDMSAMNPSKHPPARLAAFGAVVLVAGCMVGTYPPDEHNKVAKPYIYDSAATDPLGVLMAGETTVKSGQVFNLSDGMLEGGSDVPMLSALPDFSQDALSRQVQLSEALITPFTAAPDAEGGFDSSKLPPALWTEYGTLLNRAERAMFRIREEQWSANNPLAYMERLGLLLYAPLELNYAPEADRMAAIIQRLERTPGYVQTAQANLESSSELHIDAAKESAAGLISLIRDDIADRMPAGLRRDFEAASDAAVAAIEGYRDSLDNLADTDSWRSGGALVHRKLELDAGHALPPVETLIEQVEEEMEGAHSALVSAAVPINRRIYGGSRPRDDYRLINDVLEVLEGENRARSNAAMMDLMTKDTEAARSICNEEEIAPVPDELNLRVVETPEFMRVSVPLAGGLGPTAAPDDQTAVVWLTPAPPDASRAELRDRLTTNNVYQLRLLALRFGIPGYALIGSLAADMESEESKLKHIVDPLPGFIHGWPIYITETTVGTAYTGETDFIWRKYKLQVIAAALVDLQMHTGEMTTGDAIQLLTRRAYMESSAARALVRSIQLNPARACTAYLGWKGWQKVRAHYQETTQDFSLTSFHGKALRVGAMPLIEFSYAVTDAKGRLELGDPEEQ